MERLDINEILLATDGKFLSGNADISIDSICIDSKKVQEGSLFVPIKGEKFDAHMFIDDAFKAGAVATLTSQHETIESDKVYIRVNDTKVALQCLAAYYRQKFDIPTIGITGSVGKTSTKEMISAALSSRFNVLKTGGNLNGQIGLPLTIFEIESKHDVAVLEMGVSEFNEMDKLVEMALPKFAVMTNIGVTHIENFKTKENILKEKFKITKNLTKDSYLFVNADDELLGKIQNSKEFNIISFGIKNEAMIKAENICQNEEMTEFDVIYDGKSAHIIIPTIGEHNVYNALSAIAVGLVLNMSINDLQKGLLRFKSLNMRQCIHHLKDITVVDDSYNANPDSMKSALKVLSQLSQGRRKIAVLADMLELGEISEELHYDVGKFAAKIGIDILITVGELAKFIAKGAAGSNDRVATYSFYSNVDAYNCLNDLMSKGDCILVKGSRGMHTEEIVKEIFSQKK